MIEVSSFGNRKIRLGRSNIETKCTKPTVQHFARCNNAKCGVLFVVDSTTENGELGLLCPTCSAKAKIRHVIQCSSCKTVVNMIGALASEEKQIFTIDKCSHCYGTVEDERNIAPVYHSEYVI